MEKIAEMYGITRARVLQIVQEERKLELWKMNLLNSKKMKTVCFRDRLITLFSYLDEELSDEDGKKSTANVKSAIYCLFRYMMPEVMNFTAKECLDKIMDFTYDELMDIRNVGSRKASIIQMIQDEIDSNYYYYENLLVKNCKNIIPF